MKRFLLAVTLCVLSVVGALAQMTDKQVTDFIARETKAGTSQSQIVTKLIQKGVKIDQIRRIRNNYDSQLKNSGKSKAADAAVSEAASVMRVNNGTKNRQEVTTGRTEGDFTLGDEAPTPDETIPAVESAPLTGKRVFGRDIFNQRALSFEPNMNIATPQNYVLGPGDQVVIEVYGASQKSLVLTVSPE